MGPVGGRMLAAPSRRCNCGRNLWRPFAASPNLSRSRQEGAMFKHILLPTDGSDLSRKAVLYGVQLAKACGSKVTGLTLAEPYRVGSMDAVLISVGRDEYEQESRRISELALERVRMAAEAAGGSCDTIRGNHHQPHPASTVAAPAHGTGL